MLPKINRINKKKDFSDIFKKGKGFKNGFLILKFINNSLGFSRFGIVVSQKVSKKAVMRNKVRRRLGEIISKDIDNIKSGIDCVFIALPGIDKKDFLQTKELAEDLFKKAKITNN